MLQYIQMQCYNMFKWNVEIYSNEMLKYIPMNLIQMLPYIQMKCWNKLR